MSYKVSVTSEPSTISFSSVNFTNEQLNQLYFVTDDISKIHIIKNSESKDEPIIAVFNNNIRDIGVKFIKLEKIDDLIINMKKKSIRVTELEVDISTTNLSKFIIRLILRYPKIQLNFTNCNEDGTDILLNSCLSDELRFDNCYFSESILRKLMCKYIEKKQVPLRIFFVNSTKLAWRLSLFLSCIEETKQPTGLFFDSTELSIEHVSSIIKLIESNLISELCFSDIILDEKTYDLLSKAISKTTKLNYLNLKNTNLKNETIQTFSIAVGMNKSIEKIILDDNPFSEVRSLCLSFMIHPKIWHISCRNENMEVYEYDWIRQTVYTNKQIFNFRCKESIFDCFIKNRLWWNQIDMCRNILFSKIRNEKIVRKILLFISINPTVASVEHLS